MTKDEALDMLEEAVKRNAPGQFMKIEDAMNVAAQALNYIMGQVDDGPSGKDSD